MCRKCVLNKSWVWVQYISDVTPGDFAHHVYPRHSLPATAAPSVSWGCMFLEQLPALSLSICAQNTIRVARRREEAVDESCLFCFANNQVPSFELSYAALTDWLGGRWLLRNCCRTEVIFFQILCFYPLAAKKSSWNKILTCSEAYFMPRNVSGLSFTPGIGEITNVLKPAISSSKSEKPRAMNVPKGTTHGNNRA